LDIKMATQVCGLPNPAHRTYDSGLPIDMLVHVSNHHHTHDGAHHDGDNFNPNESKHVSVCEINATYRTCLTSSLHYAIRGPSLLQAQAMMQAQIEAAVLQSVAVAEQQVRARALLVLRLLLLVLT